MRRFIVLAILLISVSALVTAVVENASTAGQRAASQSSVEIPRRMAARDRAGGEEPEPPVQVFATSSNEGDHVIYRYRVVNGSAWPIAQLLVGYNHLRDETVIGTGPVGWNGDTAATSSVWAPTGWFGETIGTEGMDSLYIHWQVDTVTNVLNGAQELVGFTVSVPAADSMYEKGPWTVYLSAGPMRHYTGRLAFDATASVPLSSVFARNGITSIPNPTRGTVTISFRGPTTGATLIEMYDASGRLVRRLPGKLTAGQGSVLWDQRNSEAGLVAPGMYFVRVKAGAMERFSRVTVLR
jgi:hypothetical protein